MSADHTTAVSCLTRQQRPITSTHRAPPPNDLEHFHSRECKSFLINIQQGISLPPWWFVLISVLWPMTSWLLKRVILLDKSENSELRTGKVLELGSKREETFWRIFVFYSHVSALKSKLNVHEGELNVIMHEPLWLKTTDSDRLSFQLCSHWPKFTIKICLLKLICNSFVQIVQLVFL